MKVFDFSASEVYFEENLRTFLLQKVCKKKKARPAFDVIKVRIGVVSQAAERVE